MVSDWHKSSYSGGTSECVEVREHSTGSDMRDTRNRAHGRLTFTPKSWSAFLLSLTRAGDR